MSRRLCLLLALSLLLGTVIPNDTTAHLSIIRQGAESAETPEDGDLYGQSVVAGDFNGDGYEDLATGSPNEAIGERDNSGKVIISFGSAHGLTHEGARFLSSGDFGNPQNEGALFGASLSAADLNGDGRDDLIVGTPREVHNGVTGAGRIYIYAGNVNGIVPWTSFFQEDLGGASNEDDRFGFALTTGHFNNDIYRDIAIGSPGHNALAGTVFILYGAAGANFGSSELFSATTFGLPLDPGDFFGFSLASGNVIGDTTEDLIIGSPFRSAPGLQNAGVCYVIPGSSSGILESEARWFTAEVEDDPEPDSAFGYSVAVLELGLYDRIAVGEPTRDIGQASGAGRVVIVDNDVNGPIYGSTIVLTQESVGMTSEPGDEFGSSLAAGYFEEDGWMDLAIGSPMKDVGSADTGMTHVVLGGSSDIGSSGFYGYGQGAIGEYLEPGDHAGTSVTFGEFDATNNGTLVIGVPGEDNGRGLVHIVAPWRQFAFQSHRTAMVTDCQGDIIFSQKPFEQVFIASTTKIMTVLLACERSQLPVQDPDYYPLSHLYTVPLWVEEDLPGSTADLLEGEVVSLFDLMHLALLISGNDAAHAIGDLLHGSHGQWESIPDFIAEMNARAQELGMNDTEFNNANGYENEMVGPEIGEHYSTASDMEILSRAAMSNPLFREVSSALNWTAMRLRPDGPYLHDFGSFQSWILDNDWGMHGTGLKGGFTPAAQTTWCVSAEDHGRAIATTFGTAQGMDSRGDALRLLTLGLGDCATWNYDQDWELEFLYVRDGITAVAGGHNLYSMWPSVPRSMDIDLFRASTGPLETNAIMRVRRESQLDIAPNETIPFGVAPFDGLEWIDVTSSAEGTVKLYIEVDGSGAFYNIDYGETLRLPVQPSPGPSLDWSITSHFNGPASLSVQEVYAYDVIVGPEVTPDPVFSVHVERNVQTSNDLLTLEIDWFEDGSDYVLVVHEPEVVVGAEGLPFDAAPEGRVLVPSPAAPNPFVDETSIRFALYEAAEVAVSIYDATGRQVRQFPGARRDAGVWSLTWDGRLEDGARAVPGVYFYKMSADGLEAGSGKLVRLQ